MLGHRFVQGYAFDQIKLALSGRLHERAHGRLVACFSAQLRGIDALHGPCAVHPLSTGSAAPVTEAAASVANPRHKRHLARKRTSARGCFRV
jgi:hypothetical protein